VHQVGNSYIGKKVFSVFYTEPAQQTDLPQ